MQKVYVINADSCPKNRPDLAIFSDPPHMDDDREGLSAVGGCFNSKWLQHAYREGIFPWFIENGKPWWFCPPVRCVLLPQDVHIGKTLRKFLKHNDYHIWINRDPTLTMKNCATARGRNDEDGGTWISKKYINLYPKQKNFMSVEIWSSDNRMVGGLYGLIIGGTFCGESQFSLESNTSKMATVALCSLCIENNIEIIDCQMENEYLMSMGAVTMERSIYLSMLKKNLEINHPDFLFEAHEYQLSTQVFGIKT